MDDGLRASDADRDGAAAQLHVHFAAGRLTPDELDDRLTAALAARTFGDLRQTLADLPRPAPGLQQAGRLERGYRRLLAFYPPRYRRVHEEEMLAVLMTRAPEGKRRPGLAEAADLILGALRVRCQPSRGGAAGPARRSPLALVRAGAMLGLLAGIAFAVLNPPLLTSRALVAISPGPIGQYQGPLAVDSPVLLHAQPGIRPAISLQTLQSRVQLRTVGSHVVSISAQGSTAAQAVRTANAVARSYVIQGTNGRFSQMTGIRSLKLLAPASPASGRPLAIALLDTGGLGALCGALIGATGAVALSRPSRRRHLSRERISRPSSWTATGQ